MSAEELRSFVQEALEQLDDKPRTALVDALIARATKGNSGWKPSSPGNEIVREVETFTAAVRRIGYAAPEQIDDYLRQGMKAFLGGDYATARAIYQALLPPIAEADIDLGQHELVDEVLTVRVHDCAAQYLVTVYAATPLEARPEALWRAIGAVDGISTFWEPLGEMELVAPEPLPELDAFLPRWLARVEREPSSENEWEDHRDRWLRETAERLERVAGLARLARQTGRPRCLQRGCRRLLGSRTREVAFSTVRRLLRSSSGGATPPSVSRARGSARRLWFASCVGSAPGRRALQRWESAS